MYISINGPHKWIYTSTQNYIHAHIHIHKHIYPHIHMIHSIYMSMHPSIHRDPHMSRHKDILPCVLTTQNSRTALLYKSIILRLSFEYNWSRLCIGVRHRISIAWSDPWSYIKCNIKEGFPTVCLRERLAPHQSLIPLHPHQPQSQAANLGKLQALRGRMFLWEARVPVTDIMQHPLVFLGVWEFTRRSAKAN